MPISISGIWCGRLPREILASGMGWRVKMRRKILAAWVLDISKAKFFSKRSRVSCNIESIKPKLTTRNGIIHYIHRHHIMTMDNACLEFRDRSAKLTMLNLSGQGIGSSGMKRLAESISNPRPAKVLARQLPYRSPLVCLWLDNNDLHPSSVEDLSRLVALSPSLRHLHLAHNSLGNQGAKIISEISFDQLQVCNLTDNEIGLTGAISIAHKLKDPNCSIQTLILNSNYLRDEGVMEIAEALEFNTSLKTLELRYNDISRRGLLALREVLSQRGNMTLQILHLDQEGDDEHCLPTLPNTRYSQSKPTLTKSSRTACCCDCCRIKYSIEFFLALNRAGRHSFSNLELPPGLWSRILAKASHDDPSLLHAALSERPDIVCTNNTGFTVKDPPFEHEEQS